MKTYNSCSREYSLNFVANSCNPSNDEGMLKNLKIKKKQLSEQHNSYRCTYPASPLAKNIIKYNPKVENAKIKGT